MPEQGEACSSVYLARHPFGLGVDALGRAVAVGKREGGNHGADVPVQDPGEGMEEGHSAVRTWAIQRMSESVVDESGTAGDVQAVAQTRLSRSHGVLLRSSAAG